MKKTVVSRCGCGVLISIFLAVFLGVITLLVFTGCSPRMASTQSARKWFEDEYQLQIDIDRQYILREDENGYKDRVWTARLEERPEIEFEIVCDVVPASYGRSTRMKTNYDFVLGKYYFLQYKQTHYAGPLVYLDLHRYGTYDMFIVGNQYSNRESMTPAYEDLKSFVEYLGEQQIKVKNMRVYMSCSDILMTAENHNETETYITESENIELLAERVYNEYISYCIRNQVNVDEFTQQEREDALSKTGDCLVAERPDGTIVTYADLAPKRYGYGLSFGTIYELLRRENYPTLEGTVSEFSFIGIDGAKYTFSYIPAAYYVDDKEIESYCYIRNNETIFMEFYWYNFLSDKEVKEITGYSVCDH